MTSDDPSVTTPGDRLNDSLIEFTACIGDALEDLCSYGLTIGETYVPFSPDEDEECDDGDSMCSQAWVRVMGLDAVQETDSWDRSCAVTLNLTLEVGIVRCIEGSEGGEAPSATAVLVAATQAMDDMQAILCAALACPAWEGDIEAGSWAPSGPLGYQFGGTWTFNVAIT